VRVFGRGIDDRKEGLLSCVKDLRSRRCRDTKYREELRTMFFKIPTKKPEACWTTSSGLRAGLGSQTPRSTLDLDEKSIKTLCSTPGHSTTWGFDVS